MPALSIHVIVRSAGVLPVSVHVIVRSAGVPEMIVTHGIYLQYITVKAAPVNK